MKFGMLMSSIRSEGLSSGSSVDNFTSTSNDLSDLHRFYLDIPQHQKVLVVIGGGTAALTYLYTADIEPIYTHIVILGDRGYWGYAGHRLAQPHHIFALPHAPSDEYIDSAEHDATHGILPHDPRSAYVHSNDFQARLIELEKATCEALAKNGKKVFIARAALVTKIERQDGALFRFEINNASSPIFANKVIVATGAGPARKLSPDLHASLSASAAKVKTSVDSPDVNEMILDYTDVLRPVVAKCKNKDVIIYGGGATAAWAMEVAALTAKPIAWIAKNGFDKAIVAGPRVGAIIDGSRSVQMQGEIDALTYETCPVSGKPKLLVSVVTPNITYFTGEGESKEVSSVSGTTTKHYRVDYLFNCIGQEPYERGGLPEILSPNIKSELTPYLDKNNVTGDERSCMLGWSTQRGDLMIIGAAQGTYYDRDRSILKPPSVSQYLPRSGQDGITIGSVVFSVCALTNYMPFSQDANTGDVVLTSLNLHVMNATQLAAYFTAQYPKASAREVNEAVKAFILERIQTEFGLSKKRLAEFLHARFGHVTIQPIYQVPRVGLFSSSATPSMHAVSSDDDDLPPLISEEVYSCESFVTTERFFKPAPKKMAGQQNPDSFAFISSVVNGDEDELSDDDTQQATPSVIPVTGRG
jgi:hypothetical protein